jgi:hypothetical protein
MDTKWSERSEVWDPGQVGLNGLGSGAKYCHSYRRSRLDMHFPRKCLKTGKSEGLYKNDGDVGWKGSIWRRTIEVHAISMGALPRAGVAMGQTFYVLRASKVRLLQKMPKTRQKSPLSTRAFVYSMA